MGNILKKYNLTKTQWEVVGGAITGDTLPIGAIMPYTSKTTPSNWLPCNGQAVSRTTYADLFAIIGTQYGAGDGSTTFNLPDLRGRVITGLDTSQDEFNVIGKSGGSKYIQDHQHNNLLWASLTGDFINFNSGSGAVQLEPKSWSGGDGIGSPIYTGHVFGTSTGNSGNLQPYQVTNYIIKAFQSAGVVAQVSNTKSDSTTDTYSCDYINGINKYSTEEKVVGEWVGGKPIYRKVLSLGALGDTETTKTFTLSGDYQYVLDFRPYLTLNNAVNLIPIHIDDATYIEAEASSDGAGNITINVKRGNAGAWFDWNFDCVIEYTKNTD